MLRSDAGIPATKGRGFASPLIGQQNATPRRASRQSALQKISPVLQSTRLLFLFSGTRPRPTRFAKPLAFRGAPPDHIARSFGISGQGSKLPEITSAVRQGAAAKFPSLLKPPDPVSMS